MFIVYLCRCGEIWVSYYKFEFALIGKRSNVVRFLPMMSVCEMSFPPLCTDRKTSAMLITTLRVPKKTTLTSIYINAIDDKNSNSRVHQNNFNIKIPNKKNLYSYTYIHTISNQTVRMPANQLISC